MQDLPFKPVPTPTPSSLSQSSSRQILLLRNFRPKKLWYIYILYIYIYLFIFLCKVWKKLEALAENMSTRNSLASFFQRQARTSHLQIACTRAAYIGTLWGGTWTKGVNVPQPAWCVKLDPHLGNTHNSVGCEEHGSILSGSIGAI